MSRFRKTVTQLTVLAFVAFCVSFLIGTNAFAADKSKPCAEDVSKFCKDVKPGGGAIVKCLKEHEKDLSPSCKETLKTAQEKPKPCAEDVSKFCKDVKPGGGAIAKCLKMHEKDLSPSCKETLENKKN